MSSVTAHYESFLASIYLWMAGGFEHATNHGTTDVADFLASPGYAIDLGAGFGMHAIPLARAGYRVLAVDSSAHLLAELRSHSESLQVRTVVADLLDFELHTSEGADLILCMGDTLTHLQEKEQVVTLMKAVQRSLRRGGRFLATFRDYRVLPNGVSRFIPVRSDLNRIHTCILEEESQDYVAVHDLLHERSGEGWTMNASSYRKLRLSPHWVAEVANAAGLHCAVSQGPRGMVTLRADA